MPSAQSAPGRPFRGRLARSMLFALLLLSLIPLLIIASIFYLRARGLLRSQSYSLLRQASELQAQQIDARVSDGQILLSQAANQTSTAAALDSALAFNDRSDPSFIGARQSAIDRLQSVNQPALFFDQFILVKPDDTIHIATKREWEGISLAGSASFRTLEGKQAALAVFDLQPIYPESFVILTAVPLVSANGDAKATLIGVTESPAIRSLLDSVALVSSNQYFVTSDGQFIGANPFSNSIEKMIRLNPGSSQKEQLLAGLLAGEKHGAGEFPSFNNQPVFAAYTWLPALNAGWVAEASQANVFNSLNAQFLIAGLLFVLLAAAVVLITWQITRRMSSALGELSQAMQQFTHGKWEQRVPVRRGDEIGRLAQSFNEMADELSGQYQALQIQLETNSYLVQTSGEFAQIISSSSDTDELLRRAIKLIVDRFGYTQAAFYLVDESLQFAVLQQSTGQTPQAEATLPDLARINAQSLIGWVTSFNRSRVDTAGADGQAEAGIPISVGERVLGMLDVFSGNPDRFTEEETGQLQNLANLIAPALRSFQLKEASEIDLQETNLLYFASHQIAQADSAEQIFELASQALDKTSLVSGFYLAEPGGLSLAFRSSFRTGEAVEIPARMPVAAEILEGIFSSQSPLILSEYVDLPGLPAWLENLPERLNCDTVALLPVMRAGHLVSLLALGVHKNPSPVKRRFTPVILQPYANLAEQVTTALEKLRALESMDKSLNELRTLDTISRSVMLETDLDTLFQSMHQQINTVMGKVNFFVALYDKDGDAIRIPYMVEEERSMSVPPFPLGEGLTSILIRTRQPLLLVEDVANKAQELGAKLAGAPAKSWLGVPLLIGGEAIGALVVQDNERENRFNLDDQRLLSTLAGQLAVVVRNAQLLENARRQAEQERISAQISSRLWAANDIEAILQTALQELGQSLGAAEGRIQLQVEE